MSLTGPDILLRFGSADAPLDFNAENFPAGTCIMGGSGKLIRVDSWTETSEVQDGETTGDPVPTAVVTLWAHEWYEEPGALPVEVGRPTTLKAASFGEPCPGQGWKIVFPVETQVDESTPVTTVQVPDVFERSPDADTGTITKLEVAEPVEIPDDHVDDVPAAVEPEEPITLAVGDGHDGPHPSNRSRVGKLYNHVLSNNGAMSMDDIVAWANDDKLLKTKADAEDIKTLVGELAKDDWPISIENEGTEGEAISISNAPVATPHPSKLDSLRATMWFYGRELLQLGVRGVTISVIVDKETGITVDLGNGGFKNSSEKSTEI